MELQQPGDEITSNMSSISADKTAQTPSSMLDFASERLRLLNAPRPPIEGVVFML